MAIFTVQARGDDEAALSAARIVRDGFSWPAFILAQIWLLYHRLWIPLLIWVGLEAAYILLVYRFVPVPVSISVDVLAHLYIGFEGARLRVAKESTRATVTDIVEARDSDEAEVRFLRRMRPEAAAG